MSATLVGSLTAGALNPLTLSAVLPVEAQLQSNLQGALSLQAQAEIGAPSLSVQKASILEALAAIELGITLGLPGVTFSLAAAAALVASAEAALAGLGVLAGLLGGPSGGMFVYSYSGGTLASLGVDLTSTLTAQPPAGLLPSSGVSGLLIGAASAPWLTVAPYFGGL